MNKVTVVKLRNYTIISNSVLRDKRLSLKAKGLLITVLGLPDTWDFSIQGISTILKEGRDSVTAAISELIEFGYCSRVEEREPDGKFVGTDYTFYEAPIIARVEPQQENPFTDNPYTENPTQLSKEELSKEKEKKSNVSEADIVKPPKEKVSVFFKSLKAFQEEYAPPTTKGLVIANTQAIKTLEGLSDGDDELCKQIHRSLQRDAWRNGRVDWTVVVREFSFQKAQRTPEPKSDQEQIIQQLDDINLDIDKQLYGQSTH
jgi:hypothetical protein